MSRDSWATPQEFFNLVKKKWNPTLDVCASESNHKCESYLTEEDDALTTEWYPRNGVAWMNPPYSDITPWVKKAVEEAQERRVKTICLLPCDPSTKWWSICEDYAASEIILLSPRIQFVPPTGIKKSSNPKASALVIISYGFDDPKRDFWKWK